MAVQRGNGGEGGQRNVWRKIPTSTVVLLRHFREGLDDSCLVVLPLLDMERQSLPQVTAA